MITIQVLGSFDLRRTTKTLRVPVGRVGRTSTTTSIGSLDGSGHLGLSRASDLVGLFLRDDIEPMRSFTLPSLIKIPSERAHVEPFARQFAIPQDGSSVLIYPYPFVDLVDGTVVHMGTTQVSLRKDATMYMAQRPGLVEVPDVSGPSERMSFPTAFPVSMDGEHISIVFPFGGRAGEEVFVPWPRVGTSRFDRFTDANVGPLDDHGDLLWDVVTTRRPESPPWLDPNVFGLNPTTLRSFGAMHPKLRLEAMWTVYGASMAAYFFHALLKATHGDVLRARFPIVPHHTDILAAARQVETLKVPLSFCTPFDVLDGRMGMKRTHPTLTSAPNPVRILPGKVLVQDVATGGWVLVPIGQTEGAVTGPSQAPASSAPPPAAALPPPPPIRIDRDWLTGTPTMDDFLQQSLELSAAGCGFGAAKS